jgi:hypothetical protein
VRIQERERERTTASRIKQAPLREKDGEGGGQGGGTQEATVT